MSSLDVVTNVFLLTENRLLREALTRILAKKGDISVSGAAPYSSEAEKQIASSDADVVLLDSVELVFSEVRLIRALLRAVPAIKVIMIGMEPDEATFLGVVREGAVGYVLKDASALEVAAAVRAVANGEAACPPRLSMALFRCLAQPRQAGPSLHLKKRLGLTRREQQLVELISQGLTNKEIALQLNLSEQTVKNHIHRMLHKLGANDRLTIVEMCRTERLSA